MKIKKMFSGMALLCLAFLFASSTYGQEYESYYRYLGNRPYGQNPGWHEEVQGVTHDETHWYITQDNAIWKIPVEHDLEYDVNTTNSTVARIYLAMPELFLQGYNHFGDLTYYKYDDVGYLVIPIIGGQIPIIAVFRTSDLSYVGHDTVKCGEMGVGWAAVDPAGFVYTSGSQTTNYSKYSLSWNLVSQNIVVIYSDCNATIPFLDEQGADITFHHMQGGVFTEDRRHLYIVSGFYDEHYPYDGICVFDTSTNRMVQRSTNGFGLFDYEFHPGWYGLELINQEPEGITIWDLDQKGTDTIRGQLHVLMLDNDYPDEDDVFMKHYTNKIYVDGSASGGDGTISAPYQTVTQANNYAWNGSEIHITGGSYSENLTFTKSIRLVANSGTVRIGQ